MTKFDIEVVSDTVCPWCYVGKKRLESGIAAYRAARPGSEDTFSISWAPFYLNPDAPKKAIDKRQFYQDKFGPQRAKMIFETLSNIGLAEGIDFKFGGKTGNTRDSHRLIQLGKNKGEDAQTRVVEALFNAYFEREQDITSHAVLRESGIKAGLDASDVDEWLKSDKGGSQVDRETREARMRHISGVPNFTIQGEYEVGGAQDPETFVKIFEKVKARERA
ncbi:MAG: hypothetical protein M1832_001538 [Thelocarpon impressellum]|nr:MAG: hypothetical protein M1832_001538 [Thelocarpon impressellum]